MRPGRASCGCSFALYVKSFAGSSCVVCSSVLPLHGPSGRCAVLRHHGSDDRLGEAIRYLYAGWLPGSGEDTRDFPLFMQRLKFFPDVPEAEATTDIFLPLAP